MADIMVFVNSLPSAVVQGLIWGIMALGVYITYRILNFADLSVDGSFVTGGAVCVMLLSCGWNVWLAMLMALLAGMAAGFMTGFFHTVMGIPDILSGILTQLSLYSINMAIMLERSNVPISRPAQDLVLNARDVGNPQRWYIPVLICVAVVAVVIAIMYWFFGTEVGCSIRATGCNPNMARAQGINTNISKMLGLVISNGIVAFSGALFAQYSNASDVNAGRGAIVIGLAAVIIGEVVMGKRFNFAYRLASVVIGAILYYIVITLVIQLGLPTLYLKLLSAVVVAIFLAVPYIKGKYFTRGVPDKVLKSIRGGGNDNA